MEHDGSRSTLSIAPGDRLVSVRDAARQLGLDISPRTAIRWSLNGRLGQRLGTVRVGGARRTTATELRRWLGAVAAAEQRARGRDVPAAGLDARAAGAVLESFGLGRDQVAK